MRYFIKTYGCQMNKADSESIAGAFQIKGYRPAKSVNDANVVIINTCSVRQSAEDRVAGQINNIKKKDSFGMQKSKIILTGCMLRYGKEKLKEMLPGVDEFIKFKDLVKDAKPLDNAPAFAKATAGRWVKIMEGCNNYCTYCVVPYARGREVSRPMEEIVCEVKELVKRDYKQITLLGQNVNSYGKNNFALLLAALNDIKRLEKISFLTSNPQDLSDDIIKVMKLPKVDRYLHLPVQSGDDEILRKMNRRYTAKQYLALVNKIRKEIPNIEIGTDIIVGFPGETKKQFQNTIDLCKKAKFAVAYIAKYSLRPGTAAYKLKDDVLYEEKKKRWKILDKLING